MRLVSSSGQHQVKHRKLSIWFAVGHTRLFIRVRLWKTLWVFDIECLLMQSPCRVPLKSGRMKTSKDQRVRFVAQVDKGAFTANVSPSDA